MYHLISTNSQARGDGHTMDKTNTLSSPVKEPKSSIREIDDNDIFRRRNSSLRRRIEMEILADGGITVAEDSSSNHSTTSSSSSSIITGSNRRRHRRRSSIASTETGSPRRSITTTNKSRRRLSLSMDCSSIPSSPLPLHPSTTTMQEDFSWSSPFRRNTGNTKRVRKDVFGLDPMEFNIWESNAED